MYTACNDIVFIYAYTGNQGTAMQICNFELSDDTLISRSDVNANSQSDMWEWQLDENSDPRKRQFNTAVFLESNPGKDLNKTTVVQRIELQDVRFI